MPRAKTPKPSLASPLQIVELKGLARAHLLRGHRDRKVRTRFFSAGNHWFLDQQPPQLHIDALGGQPLHVPLALPVPIDVAVTVDRGRATEMGVKDVGALRNESLLH